MFSIFIIIVKSSYGIMGWRRKIVVSLLLSFLISILVFEQTEFKTTGELLKQKQGHTHTTSALLKRTTMWFWPKLLIDTLERLVDDKLPVSS